jgi:hypothetical protein
MFFQTECLIKSLKRFSKIDFFVTIIITGVESVNLIEIIQKYPILNDVEILCSNINYKKHPPVRWNVQLKADVIFIDCDVLVCNTLQNLSCKDAISGVLAHDSPFFMDEWMQIFNGLKIKFSGETFKTTDTKKEIPFYVNYGMIMTQTHIVNEMRVQLQKNIDKVMSFWKTSNSYFVGQIALTVTIEELNIKKEILPVRYNYPDYSWYDKNYSEELNKMVFYHYLNGKKSFLSKLDIQKFLEQMTLEQRSKIEPIFSQRLL